MKKITLLLSAAAAIVAIGAAIKYLNRPVTAPSALDGFAKCLRDKGTTMYGADWCPHCQNEKKAFGASFRFVSYVECPKEPQKCLAAGINVYPTWIFPDPPATTSSGDVGRGGKKLEGEMGLQKLSRESGCALTAAAAKDTTPSASAPRPGEFKTDSSGEVIVSASFKEENGQFLFDVSLDTHTITLDDFNPLTQIKLATKDGQLLVPQKISEQGSEHHREFILSFPKAAGTVKLLITNLAGTPQRELIWSE